MIVLVNNFATSSMTACSNAIAKQDLHYMKMVIHAQVCLISPKNNDVQLVSQSR